MTRLDNEQYYDRFSGGYEDARFKRYHRFLDESELRLAGPYCEGRRILEVGCGTGLILEPLSKIADKAIGLDLSAGMLRRARERGLKVVQGSVTALPFPDNSFDCVVSFKVLAHIEHIQKALSECARVLKPGGHLVLEFYNKRSLRRLVKWAKPAQKVEATTTDEQVFTRYDSLKDVRRWLPGSVRVEKVTGFRCLAPTYHFYNAPLLGPVTVALERFLRRTPAGRMGGFLVVVARKEASQA
jgi:ubiquinone/menaquinone biosynthesis C-methylase UbiE